MPLLAFEVYVHRLRAYAGAYLAQLGGVDVISFTAGVGENAPGVRAAALETLGFAGVEIDPARNEAPGRGIRVISTDASRVAVLVVPTNEELEIARQTLSVAAPEVCRTVGRRASALRRTAPAEPRGLRLDRRRDDEPLSPRTRTSPGGYVASNALPDLTSYDAVLFDLDGVLTPTAEVHMHAWQTMFEELFAAWDIQPPYTERDYFDYLDGKKRYDGVASLLRSRDVEVPWGDPSDPLDGRHGVRHRQPQERGVLARAARRGHRAVPGVARAAGRARRRRHPHRGRVELEERRRGAAGGGHPRALPPS